MEFDVGMLNIVVGTIIPILVGLLTRLEASSGVKAIVNGALSAAASAIYVLIDLGGMWALGPFAMTFFVTWTTSVATHYGLYKPAGVSAQVQYKTASFGVTGRNRDAVV